MTRGWVVAPLLVLALLTACGSSGGGNSTRTTAGATGASGATGPSTSGGRPVQAGITPTRSQIAGCLSAHGFAAVGPLGGTPFITGFAYASGGTIAFGVFPTPAAARHAATSYSQSFTMTTRGRIAFGTEVGNQLATSEGRTFVKCLFNP